VPFSRRFLLGCRNFFLIVLWFDPVQKFEQLFQLLQLPVFLITKVLQLLFELLRDRRVKANERVIRRCVLNWASLAEGERSTPRKFSRNEYTHRAYIVHEQFERTKLIVVHYVRNVEFS
jgi:hypothetical protein